MHRPPSSLATPDHQGLHVTSHGSSSSPPPNVLRLCPRSGQNGLARRGREGFGGGLPRGSGLWPALSTMRAAEKASQQQIPVHSARKSQPI
jgi:hypothetical protein